MRARRGERSGGCRAERRGEGGYVPMTKVQPNRAPHRLKLLSRTFARRFTIRKTVVSLSDRPGGTSCCARGSVSACGRDLAKRMGKVWSKKLN